eukprot:Nk52_evm33s745 gene=Nk52_evmTU33s745
MSVEEEAKESPTLSQEDPLRSAHQDSVTKPAAPTTPLTTTISNTATSAPLANGNPHTIKPTATSTTNIAFPPSSVAKDQTPSSPTPALVDQHQGEGKEAKGGLAQAQAMPEHLLPKPPGSLSMSLSLPEKFKFAISFYKREDCGVKLGYAAKNEMYAYGKQATHGEFRTEDNEEVGYFDWVGKDRRNAWIALGDMSKDVAMNTFVDMLTLHVPEFKDALERHRLELEKKEKERLKEIYEQEKLRVEKEWQAQLEQNQRDDDERRVHEELLRQVTEQRDLDASAESREKERSLLDLEAKYMMNNARKDPEYYKAWVEAVKQDPESIIVVGRGETICIRVPASGPGASIRWEFSTEDYDIYFGLSFETTGKEEGSPPVVTPILPSFRCDSHLHVISGSHTAGTDGVYLLQFDNSYSVLRSKTLYYRVFTSKPE